MVVFLFKKKDKQNKSAFRGKISVLLAVRNEENNILRCLKSLAEQDLPEGVEMEVLIGNDDSSDATELVVCQFIKEQGTSVFKLFNICEEMGEARAKSNVLAQLAHEAAGEIFFFTDADVAHRKTWVKAMLGYLNQDVSVVTGVTACEQKGFFSAMQNIDWLFSLLLAKFLADFKLPVTAMGNNMLVTRVAYFETGGFENLEFSITEDFQLFHEVVKNGHGFRNVFDFELLGVTQAKSSLLELLNQRKRWMSGAMKLPWHMLGLLFMQVVYYPILIVCLVTMPLVGFVIMVSKNGIQYLLISEAFRELKLNQRVGYIFFYELYFFFQSLLTLTYFVLPNKVEWKGRRY